MGKLVTHRKRKSFAGSLIFPCSNGMRADRKSTRLNSSHTVISYAVFCLKKKNNRIAKILFRYEAPVANVAPSWTHHALSAIATGVGDTLIRIGLVVPCDAGAEGAIEVRA